MPQDNGIEIWSVGQLTRRIKSMLEMEVGEVWLSGEISNWKVAASGHAYFTLKDADSQIDAVIFKGAIGKLRFEPESGLEVLARGRVTVYERRGNYQIVLSEMQPKGVGALQLAYERLKKKLDAEGLFDPSHKKPLPLLPKKIGVVTSPTGAAIRDILNVLNRRFANLHVLIYPARVQGEGAANEIAAGIAALDAYGVDVMIVGRGGGSLEDLWPFNEEAVARAIFNAGTPIISAVGHEIDFALSDFVADLRAPTPSAAAELVVQEQAAMLERMLNTRRRLARATARHLEQAKYALSRAKRSYVFQRPDELIRQRRQRADELRLNLDSALRAHALHAKVRLNSAQRTLQLLSPTAQLRVSRDRLKVAQRQLRSEGREIPAQHRAKLLTSVARLETLSPLAILSRGYALAKRKDDGSLVRDANTLKCGDTLELRFGRGGATAEVTSLKD